MHKSFSIQKAVKRVIWERDSWENYQRVKGENCFSLYLHTCLVDAFLACSLSFLGAFSRSHSTIKHLNMLQIWWEGALNFHLESLIIKHNARNTEFIFSLCCLLPGISEGRRGWDSGWDVGSQEQPDLWCPQLTTRSLQRWDKEMGGAQSLILPWMWSCLPLQLLVVG